MWRTATVTQSPTLTWTYLKSETTTGTYTFSDLPSQTASSSRSQTYSTTFSLQYSGTMSLTPTLSSSLSAGLLVTDTLSRSGSTTISETPSQTYPETLSGTPTLSSSVRPQPTSTRTHTASGTPTPTGTISCNLQPSSTLTNTPSMTSVQTRTTTSTHSPSSTRVLSPSLLDTRSYSQSPSGSYSSDRTDTPASSTPTGSVSASLHATSSLTHLLTKSDTPTQKPTFNDTVTHSHTSSDVATATFTGSGSLDETTTPSQTLALSESDSQSSSHMPPGSGSKTETPSGSFSPIDSGSSSLEPTETATTWSEFSVDRAPLNGRPFNLSFWLPRGAFPAKVGDMVVLVSTPPKARKQFQTLVSTVSVFFDDGIPGSVANAQHAALHTVGSKFQTQELEYIPDMADCYLERVLGVNMTGPITLNRNQLGHGGREVVNIPISETTLLPGPFTICLWQRLTDGNTKAGTYTAVPAPLNFEGPEKFVILHNDDLAEYTQGGPVAFQTFALQGNGWGMSNRDRYTISESCPTKNPNDDVFVPNVELRGFGETWFQHRGVALAAGSYAVCYWFAELGAWRSYGNFVVTSSGITTSNQDTTLSGAASDSDSDWIGQNWGWILIIVLVVVVLLALFMAVLCFMHFRKKDLVNQMKTSTVMVEEGGSYIDPLGLPVTMEHKPREKLNFQSAGKLIIHAQRDYFKPTGMGGPAPRQTYDQSAPLPNEVTPKLGRAMTVPKYQDGGPTPAYLQGLKGTPGSGLAGVVQQAYKPQSVNKFQMLAQGAMAQQAQASPRMNPLLPPPHTSTMPPRDYPAPTAGQAAVRRYQAVYRSARAFNVSGQERADRLPDESQRYY